MREILISKTRLKLVQGDITQVEADVIINAANSYLIGGGGVDAAIHRVGGPKILAECRKLGGCRTGQAVITTAGYLKAKKLIHTVGPIYQGQPEDPNLLASCYINSLELAARYELRNVAFPSIATGAYRYPLMNAAEIALQAVKATIEFYIDAFDEIQFVLFSKKTYKVYEQVLNNFDTVSNAFIKPIY